jgi:hypothetical protein
MNPQQKDGFEISGDTAAALDFVRRYTELTGLERITLVSIDPMARMAIPSSGPT